MQQIIAIGGGTPAAFAPRRALERYILKASGKDRPRVTHVGTASGDNPENIANFYDRYASLGCDARHLTFFRRTPRDLREIVLGSDVIHVGGGNTRSMLAVWREWELVPALIEALENGTVLCGGSAGAICWFEWGVTDSIDGPLTLLPCLGILAGSCCPHFDGEPERRPAFARMVQHGEIPPTRDGSNVAIDDGTALHYVDGKLERTVSASPAGAAYRLALRGAELVEHRIEPLRLNDGVCA
jgi:peptidase E